MATKKTKKKQIKDFAHEIDDPKGHKASPEDKRGKVVTTSLTTGEIELIDATKVVPISGMAGDIPGVKPKYQIEFYKRVQVDPERWELVNLYHRYRSDLSRIHWKSNNEIEYGKAIIKEL